MGERSITSEVHPFSLGLYLLIVFALSWPFQIAGAVWASDLLPRYVFTAISMFMVAVGTFIAGRYVFQDGFAGAGWRWGRPKHYLAVIGLVLLLWVVPTLIALSMGRSLPASLTRGEIAWVFVLLFVTLIPGFGEEFGWRGYMLPRLARRLTLRKALIVHGIIWWAWHLPVSVGIAVHAGIVSAESMRIPVGLSVAASVSTTVLIGAIPTILHGIVFAYIWSSSRSLAVATMYHAAYDGVRDSLGMTIGFGAMTGLWVNLLLIILGVAFLWKGDWRGLEASAGAPEASE